VPKDVGLACALCTVKACCAPVGEKQNPSFCPSLTDPELLQEVEQEYLQDPETQTLARESARTEAAGYGRATRFEETMDFARRIGAHKLGIAHCVGFVQETKTLREILLANGFQVHAVCCKVGSIPKERIGLQDSEKVTPGKYEAMCSPVGQAALLARAGTQLNIVLGLCVGHDSLFFMHSTAPATG
jgi:uncharacterized metal-binding protein